MKLQDAVAQTAAWLRGHPDNHATGFLALDADGQAVTALSPRACAFCAFGYLARLCHLDFQDSGEIIDFFENEEHTPVYDAATEVVVLNDTFKLEEAAAALEKWGTLVCGQQSRRGQTILSKRLL